MAGFGGPQLAQFAGPFFNAGIDVIMQSTRTGFGDMLWAFINDPWPEQSYSCGTIVQGRTLALHEFNPDSFSGIPYSPPRISRSDSWVQR